MFTIFSIKRFLFSNLVSIIILAILGTASATYYIDDEVINAGLDNLLVETGWLLKTITNNPRFLTPSMLNVIQSQLNIGGIFKKNASYSLLSSTQHTQKQLRYKFQLWDEDNKLLLSSEKTPTQSFISKPGLNDKMINGQKWRTFTIYDKKHSVILVLAEQYAARATFINDMLIRDISLTLFIYLLSGLLIWLAIGRGLKSIRFFAKEMAERAVDHLDPVDLNEVPAEIKPLVDELNKLFFRLQQAFEREQRFAAEAAHELHTPLAALKTQAQVALKTTNSEECYLNLKQVIASVDRCSHVIQQLLTLCRLSPETILPEHFTHVDLSCIATEVIAQLAPNAVLKRIEIELVANDSDYMLLGNTTGLHVLIRNLVDNAIRYTPTEGIIKVLLMNTDNSVILHVIDNGPGIPDKLRTRVFERFFRVLGTNTQGSGLGLAIVEQIIKLHKGSISLDTPPDHIGLHVEVRFPKKR
ncbi:ATP-binding protein [Rickettsiella grylli]|uniref:histidine kinase n=1 Tax=Rickettsiella grylli TaxID=59196 RepID=A8PNE9_9COXI|nr:ATP-binding protein [Rickettsiella grylli]EDP46562.1 two component sensor kinase [Rickettsiella grylli]